jgi:hypothetical protein
MELKTNNSQRTNKDHTIHNMDLRDSVNTADDPNKYVSRMPHMNTSSFDNRGQQQ